ncbi:MAG: hypothetical protein H6716_26555 [Polyangiaceae bacterium]|nr:hypothetical protein [Polyangiaceae bacterium]
MPSREEPATLVVGLDLSSTSAVQALRMHLSRLAQTEPVIEAKVSVHGAP